MLAEGFKSSLELISGPNSNIHIMSFYSGNGSYTTEIYNRFESLKEDEQLFICTDIQFGSVNQLFLRESIKWNKENVFILSGVNLPLLLEIVVAPGLISKEELLIMVEKASEQIVLFDAEDRISENNSNDDELW